MAAVFVGVEYSSSTVCCRPMLRNVLGHITAYVLYRNLDSAKLHRLSTGRGGKSMQFHENEKYSTYMYMRIVHNDHFA